MDSCGWTCPLVTSVQVVLRKAPGCLQGARHRKAPCKEPVTEVLPPIILPACNFTEVELGSETTNQVPHTCAEYLGSESGSGPRRRQIWERLLGSTKMTGAPSPLVYKAQPEPQWLQPTRGKYPEFSCQPCEWGWWKKHRRTLPSPT